MVIDGYFKLDAASYLQCPVKEHLGHKVIGVEPDLAFDLTLAPPRIFIRNELVDLLGELTPKLIQGAYLNPNNTHAYQNFSVITADHFSLPKVEADDDLPAVFYYQQALYLSQALLDEMTRNKKLKDIEYRV
ncbi:hypothetical protein [Vibrio sp. T11.5]|uniref:hypothetical protein n=1 Tax=Vibrio sp. T11.5 TaxID=2998836 RepID=UPI0022CD5B68|nr:hypothetical protein [Vibrio sp. T11.5]MDA0118206.1 hypothetical protein [Vibrio sp. T11.5]